MKYAIFHTALGEFGIGWTEAGIRRVLLPGDAADRMAEKLGGEAGEPSACAASTIRLIQSYADGEAADFSDVPLDLSGVPEFHRQVYDLLVEVGPGETTTYGALAERLGNPAWARAVGQALGANPLPLLIPCHRVLGARGALGGFSAPGGAGSKRRMLMLEGARTGAAPAEQLAFGF